MEKLQIIEEIDMIVGMHRNYDDLIKRILSLRTELSLQEIKEEKQGSILNTDNYSNQFQNEDLKIFIKDYYFSNVIARSSKTMLNCHNSKLETKRTGTEG